MRNKKSCHATRCPQQWWAVVAGICMWRAPCRDVKWLWQKEADSVDIEWKKLEETKKRMVTFSCVLQQWDWEKDKACADALKLVELCESQIFLLKPLVLTSPSQAATLTAKLWSWPRKFSPGASSLMFKAATGCYRWRDNIRCHEKRNPANVFSFYFSIFSFFFDSPSFEMDGILGISFRH